MATGSTPPIPGLLTGWVDVAQTVAYFAAPNELTDVTFRLGIPASGGTVTVKLNTESDGSGDGLTVVIADGADIGTASGTVTIAASSYLYQIVTSEPSENAENLSGDYTVTLSSGVTQLLTSLSRVKAYLDITTTDTGRDLVLNHIMAGVSARMTSYMARAIIQQTTTDEKIDSGGDIQVQTRHYPIISVSSLTEAGTALVEDTDFEMTPEDLERGQITRISGDDPIGWERGRRVVKLTYVNGYAAIPEDLIQAATEATAIKYLESGESGTNRWIGLASKGVDPASSVTLDKDHWTREVVPVLNQYRRLVV